MRRYVPTLSRALHFFAVFASAGSLAAQSTSVVNLATINASQAADGLGFSVSANQDWQWAAVAAAGGTHARISCSWAGVEQQTAPPNNAQANPAYITDPNCALGFASAARYGIKPTIVAAFGAPYHQILTVTVPKGAALGATSIDVQFSSGVGGDTLANLKFPYDYICPLMAGTTRCLSEMSNRSSPGGTFIAGITQIDAQHATLNLASALNVALPADSTPYVVNEILYPSTNTNDPNDPSIVAYANYVSFMADDMAQRGVTGDIEIWNEPPWIHDPWDFRADLYDSGLWTGPALPGANFGFAANLQHRTLPAGITLTWNGTSGNGFSSLLGSQMLTYSGEKLMQPSTVITKESFHPYGGGYGIPEYTIMSPDCMETAAKSSDPWGKNIYGNGRNCYLPGVPQGANLMQAVEYDDVAKLTSSTYGIGHSITETNNPALVSGKQVLQARSNVRQFLAFQSVGVTPVEFFEMWNGINDSDPSYSFVDYDGTNFVPRIGYTALAGMMADIKSIGNAPATTTSAAVQPSVASYSGTFPLTTVSMVGTRTNVTQNSVAFFVWQLSTCSATRACWFDVTTPAGSTTINIPANLKVTSVRDQVTQTDVAYTTNGQQITFAVADNPIEVLTDPASWTGSANTQNLLQPTSIALSATPVSSPYGAQVTISAVLTPSSTKTATTNGQTVAIYDGATLLGTPALVSGAVTVALSSPSVGTHTLKAVYLGNKSFGGSVGAGTYTVVPAKSQLTLTPIADQTYGTASVQLGVSSTSPGALTYAVVSGPARIGTISSAGAVVALTGTGQVVLQVNQQAVTGYTAQSAQVSFTVNPATPQLTFNTVPTQTYGNRDVYLLAGSASHGTVSYSVVSGPATISGNTVTLTGAGTVVVQASQAATTTYAAASATQSFVVQRETPTMTIGTIRTQTFGGAAITETASSTSPAPITYSIVSGPASVSGSTISILGAGTIVVEAQQAVSQNYTAANIQTSFVALPGSAQLQLNSFPTETYGVGPLPLLPSTLSPAPIVYSVVAGSAHISGSTIVLDGEGYIVVRASQAATANYLAAAAQTSFRVTPGTPNLSFTPVPTQSGLTPSFSVAARSNSPATISYGVVSGPAKINNNVVTVTGFGTVQLRAVQPATGAYLSRTATTTFLVVPTSADIQ